MTNDNLALYQDAGNRPAKDYRHLRRSHAARRSGAVADALFPDTATTRDINKAQIYAWKKGIKTLYYIRLRQLALEGTEIEGCVSCAL
jgi:ribonucleoside-diphosphate reductase alpha chain